MKREASYESHAAAAKAFLRDGAKAKWHDDTLWFIRSKRDTASKKLADWEALREAASNMESITHLPKCICNGWCLHDFDVNTKSIAHLYGVNCSGCELCGTRIAEAKYLT